MLRGQCPFGRGQRVRAYIGLNVTQTLGVTEGLRIAVQLSG